MILSGVFLYFLNLIFLVPLVEGGGRGEVIVEHKMA